MKQPPIYKKALPHNKEQCNDNTFLVQGAFSYKKTPQKTAYSNSRQQIVKKFSS
jgi:hypothetical protein